MESTVKKLLAASACGTIIAGVLYYAMTKSSSSSSSTSSSNSTKKKSSSKKKKRGKTNDKGSSDAVDLQTAINIFTKINQQMMSIMQSMAMYEQQIRQKAAGQVTEEELRDHINQTFVQELTKCERKVYETFHCAESEVQAAVKLYRDEPELKNKIDSLKKLFTVVRVGTDGAKTPSEMKLPEGLDRDKAFEILKKVMNSIIASIDKVGKLLAPDGGKLQMSQIKEFNAHFLQETEKSAADISKEYGITPQVSFSRSFPHFCFQKLNHPHRIFSFFFFFSFMASNPNVKMCSFTTSRLFQDA